MKKLFLTLLMTAVSATSLMAQKYAFVESEYIFKNIPEYTQAIQKVEQMTKDYQKAIDEKFAAVETRYNNYQKEKNYLSASARAQVENSITNMETEATKFQNSIFGPEGEMDKKRVETIKPIQDKVFNTIEIVAKEKGYDMVIDRTANPYILYYNPTLNISKDVLKKLGYTN